MSPGKSRHSVLVIERDEAIRATIEWLLSEHGYDVRVARTCDEAVSAARPGELDLVLSDIVPEPGGADAAVRAAGQLRARLLFICGQADQPLARSALRCEWVWLLPKPFTPDALLRTLDAVLGG